MQLEEQAGWISLAAVVLVLVFVFGVLVGGRDNPREISLKDPMYSAPVVKNGVAAVMLCGKMRDELYLGLTKKALGKGKWTAPPPQEGCQVWYHRPPHLNEEWYREGTGGSPTTGPASWYWYWGGD